MRVSEEQIHTCLALKKAKPWCSVKHLLNILLYAAIMHVHFIGLLVSFSERITSSLFISGHNVIEINERYNISQIVIFHLWDEFHLVSFI